MLERDGQGDHGQSQRASEGVLEHGQGESEYPGSYSPEEHADDGVGDTRLPPVPGREGRGIAAGRAGVQRGEGEASVTMGEPRPAGVERLPGRARGLGERAQRVVQDSELAEGSGAVVGDDDAADHDIDAGSIDLAEERIVRRTVFRVHAPLDQADLGSEGGTPIVLVGEGAEDDLDRGRPNAIDPVECGGERAKGVAPDEPCEIFEGIGGGALEDEVR